MASVLILGGTRDIGHFTALALLEAGHRVAVLNRGHAPDELPVAIERIRADRSTAGDLERAIDGRTFDVVLDTTTYNGDDAREAIRAFSGRVGRYVFISTGQVYLVRTPVERPFREHDYEGALIAEPERGTPDHDSWRYGVEKREAEEAFGVAWKSKGFPVTTLRIPVVASERDPAGRTQAYLARLLDGGPILIPSESELPLRHLYVGDLARLIVSLVNSSVGIGGAFNISFGESMSLPDFVDLLGRCVAVRPALTRVERTVLESHALLPDCSPFSSRWMSELDNSHGVAAFTAVGMTYTSPAQYLATIADDYLRRWRAAGLQPRGYPQRSRELTFARSLR